MQVTVFSQHVYCLGRMDKSSLKWVDGILTNIRFLA